MQCLDLAFTLLNHKILSPFSTIQTHSASDAVIPVSNFDTPKRDRVPRMIPQEVVRVYTKFSYEALQKTVKHALSKLFKTGNAKVKGMLKSSLYRFVETVLTNMAAERCV